jgi:hypothetical protein
MSRSVLLGLGRGHFQRPPMLADNSIAERASGEGLDMAGSGGASASDMGSGLRGQAAQARAARQAGEKVTRGSSETALKKQAKSWDAGAAGEERSAYRLDALRRAGYTVLNDVLLQPDKPWNLDHLLVGRAGALFIDAKNWRGFVRPVGGKLMRYWYGGPKTGKQSADMSAEVAKVRGMAAKASERLGVRVRPVICLTGAKSRQAEGIVTVNGVVVISVDKIVPWLRDHEVLMAPEQVKAVGELATRIFPPAVKEDPHSPEALRRARWEAGMRAGAPALATRPAPAPASVPVEVPVAAPGEAEPAGLGRWFRRSH